MASLADLGTYGDTPEQGGATLASLGQGIWNLIKYPGQLLYGEKQYDPQQASDWAANIGLAGLGSGAVVPMRLGPGEAGLGAGTIFDYSRLGSERIPDVAQTALERAAPPARGIPDYVARLGDLGNMQRMNKYVDEGLKMGAGDWYNTRPLYDAFVGELGPTAGPEKFNRFIDYMAATSPQNKTPANARTGAYYYMRDAMGDPVTREAMPINPYGHYVQGTHMRGAEDIASGQGISTVDNPKVASFGANLQGNWAPLTADIHNLRALDYRTAGGKPADSPNVAHYSFLEALQQAEAAKLGITPAEYQAAAWVGAGKDTGLRSPPDAFVKILGDAIDRNASQLGMRPEDVLRRVIRGEPLGTGPTGPYTIR